jgi:hypothetical protein
MWPIECEYEEFVLEIERYIYILSRESQTAGQARTISIKEDMMVLSKT